MNGFACLHGKLATSAAGLLYVLACGANAQASPIRHIVFVVQENRTVDNLFNGFPGADTVKTGAASSGKIVELHAADLVSSYDLSHKHAAFVLEYDGGKMDGFDKPPPECATAPGCAPDDAAYAYVPQNRVQPYWTMAREYAFADRMFQTNAGPSWPAHLYLISGTGMSGAGSQWYAMENPATLQGAITGGCDSPAGSSVALIDPLTDDQTQRMYPCFDPPTLFDLLDKAHLSWRYYQPHLGPGLWLAPDAIRHIRNGPDYANVLAPNRAIFTDIRRGSLAAVSWVIPTAAASDHPSVTDGSGPSWVASVVNAVGSSPYWSSTAIFVVWDDWGGWYDHVAPRQFNHYELGFRVPLIAISPYAKRGYVSHVQHEFGSLLKFTEETFGLPSLGYTDVRSDDLSDMFDFTAVPSRFETIAAPPVRAATFDDTRPPDDD